MSRDQSGKIEVEAWVDIETQEYYMYLLKDTKPNELQEPDMKYVGSVHSVAEYDQLISADRIKRGWKKLGPSLEGLG